MYFIGGLSTGAAAFQHRNVRNKKGFGCVFGTLGKDGLLLSASWRWFGLLAACLGADVNSGTAADMMTLSVCLAAPPSC